MSIYRVSHIRIYGSRVRSGIFALLLPLATAGCNLVLEDPLTSDDFSHTAAEQSAFTLEYAQCKAEPDSDVAAASPERFESYRDRLNAADTALVQCMRAHGYRYRDRTQLLFRL